MRDILTSPRIEDMKRKRRAHFKRLSILVSILCVVFFGALAYFSADPHVTINTVSVTGTRIINASDVEAKVREDMEGRYLGLFARANNLIYPHNRIYDDLITSFTRIETLHVSRKGWHTLHIAITERAGSYLYCGSSVPLSSKDVGENCYFINNDGYVFDKAPYFSGNVYFKYYVPASSITLAPDGATLGAHMFSIDQFHSIARFIDQVEALGFKPVHLVVSPDATYSLYLDRSGIRGPIPIIFKGDKDLSVPLNDLATAMDKAEFKNEITSKYETLLYIDLRFTNKVLYKFAE